MIYRRHTGKNLIYAMIAIALIILTITSGFGSVPAFADTSSYTSVLTDLQKDEEFMTVDYPDNENDRSITVISIAESTGGELFIYTYQPCQDTTYLNATQISMSLSDKLTGETDKPEDLTPEDRPLLYNLTLISCESVFCKYKVNGFTVRKTPERYYNIVSIFRKWLDGDPETGNDNTVKSVYYRVGKLYKAETVDGVVKYLCKDVDVIEIKNPYVDFLSYYDGMTWGSAFGLEPDKYTDVHYIAFSPDRQIDTLKEADVTYTTHSYKIEPFGGGTNYGEKSEPQYITLKGDMTGSTPGGFLAGKFTWKCIQRTEEFIKLTKLNEDSYAYDNIKDTEFILVFHTTPYTKKEVWDFGQGHSYEITGTKVSDVVILRLMFETNGRTYNLGTLMNQQEGDDVPGNNTQPISFWAYVWRCIVRLFNGTATLVEQIVAIAAIFICLLFLPAVLIVLSLVFPAFRTVMKTIFKNLLTFFKYLFTGLWWVISRPFVWLGKGIKKISERRTAAPSKPKAKPAKRKTRRKTKKTKKGR